MAYRYPRDNPRTGNVTTPREINANLKEYAEEWNGHVDRDNLPLASVGDAKVVANTFSKLTYEQLDSTGAPGTLSFATVFGQHDGRWREVTDLVKTVQTLDSRLRCIFSCQIVTTDFGQVFYGIKVDEHIYGVSDGSSQGKQSRFVQAAPVVSAGTHRIVPVIKLLNAVDNSLLTNVFSIVMHHRTLFIREMRR